MGAASKLVHEWKRDVDAMNRSASAHLIKTMEEKDELSQRVGEGKGEGGL